MIPRLNLLAIFEKIYKVKQQTFTPVKKLEEKIERLPGLTVKAMVVGILAITLTAGWYSVAGLVGHMNWYPTWTGDQGEAAFYGFAFVFVLLLWLINYAKPIFTAQEMAVIITMYYVGVAFTIFGVPHEMINNPIIKQYAAGIGVAVSWPERLPYVDSLVFGPIRDKATAVKLLTESTWSIPGEWAPTLAWTMLFYGSFAIMGVSVAILLRHWWTRVEGMPFPLAGIHMELVNATQKGKPSVLKGAGAKYFWPGFAISFLIYIPILHALGVLYPVIPGAPPSSLGPYLIVWTWDFATYNIIPWCDLFLEPWPWLIAFAYLWPIDAMNGFIFGWFIYHIFFPVLFTSMGWIPPMPYGTDSWTIDVQWMTKFPPQFGPAWKGNIMVGTLLMMFLYPLFKNVGTVKKIFQGMTKAVPEMEEEGGILSLRTGWMLLIVSLVMFIGSWIAAGTPTWFALIYVIVTFLILGVGGARIAGETPGRYGAFAYHNHFGPVTSMGILMFPATGMATEASKGATFTSWFAVDFPQTHPRALSFMIGWIAGPLVGFKLADEAKVKISDMAKAAFIAVLTWLIVTVIASLLWIYAWAWPVGTPGYGATTGSFANALRAKSDPALRAYGHGNPGLPDAAGTAGMIGAFAVSGIITLVVYILRGLIPWFAVNPVGIIASIGWDGGDDPSWGTGFIIAWLLKILTLRLGGVKLFAERGRPLALGVFFGFTIGFMLHWMFGGLHNVGLYGTLFPT